MARTRNPHRAVVGLTSLVWAMLVCGRDDQQRDRQQRRDRLLDEIDEVTRINVDAEGNCELPESVRTQLRCAIDMRGKQKDVKLGRGAGWERIEVLKLHTAGPSSTLRLEFDPKLQLDALKVLILHNVEVDPEKLRLFLMQAPALEFLICSQCRGFFMVDFRAAPTLRALSIEGVSLLQLVNTEHAGRLELFGSTALVDPSALTHARRLRFARLVVADEADLTPLEACSLEELRLEPSSSCGVPRRRRPSGLAVLQDLRTLELYGWDVSGVAFDPLLEFDRLEYFACRVCELGRDPRIPNLERLDLTRSRMRSMEWAERLDRLVSLRLSAVHLESADGLESLDRLMWLDVDRLDLPEAAHVPSARFVVGSPRRYSDVREIDWVPFDDVHHWSEDPDIVTWTFRSLGQTPPQL